MFKPKHLKSLIKAIGIFLNQPIIHRNTVWNPVIFWHIYHNRQILENCWNYDLIQFFERCWQIHATELSDKYSARNDSHSIGI
ncbi:hypothetical protein ACQFX9_18000 [Aliinostoc sp. HNIBRCY26]|uniref:hypothetical protein n=1 Tax=Aliinostoc sp. HNIBRCY26 TaxID=3418997 RepID=UPI003CFF4433